MGLWKSFAYDNKVLIEKYLDVKKEVNIALFDYMRELGIKKLSAGTAMNNIPSVLLLKSLGFTLVETEKVSFYKDVNGNDIVFDGGVFELLL